MPLGERVEIDRDQFVRQRRFLLTVSLLLFAVYVVGIKIDDSVESLGLKFTIERKELLVPFGWLVWLWALVRYAQYYVPTGRPAIERETAREVHQQAHFLLLAFAREQFNNQGLMVDGVRVEGKVVDLFWPILNEKTPPAPDSIRDHVAEWTVRPDGGRTYRASMQIIRKTNGAQLTLDGPVGLSAEEVRACERRAWWIVHFKTHVFTDYLAPFVVAAAPVAAAAVHYMPLIVGLVR